MKKLINVQNFSTSGAGIEYFSGGAFKEDLKNHYN